MQLLKHSHFVDVTFLLLLSDPGIISTVDLGKCINESFGLQYKILTNCIFPAPKRVSSVPVETPTFQL